MTDADPVLPEAGDTDTVRTSAAAEQSSQARLYPYTYEEAEEDDAQAPGTESIQTAPAQQVKDRSQSRMFSHLRVTYLSSVYSANCAGARGGKGIHAGCNSSSSSACQKHWK